MTATAIGFVSYLLVVAAIGVYALKRTRTANDYVIGGRSLSAPVAALSAGASDMSGWLLLGLPGAVYALGLGEAWIVVGLTCGAWANWRLVAAKLRDFSERLQGAVTLPQLFARRVDAKTRLPAIVASALVLFFFAIYTAAGFVAGAKLFESTLGLDYTVALWVGVVLVLSYTALGGFLAVSWTDCFQALLMLGALVLVAALAFAHTPANSVVTSAPGLGGLAVVSALAWGLGYFGQPHILARFMAIEGRRRRAACSAHQSGLDDPCRRGRGCRGRRWRRLLWRQPPRRPGDRVHRPGRRDVDALARWRSGSRVLAAVMSTVDSQLLVAATALVEDVLRPLLTSATSATSAKTTKTPSDKHLLFASRCTVASIAVIAGLIAMDPQSQVLQLVAYAWAGLGASFGPAVLACLFWRRTTEAGLVAGMVAGAACTVIWHHLAGGLFDLYEIVPGFAAASITIIALSRRPDDAAKVFDRISKAA